jgi:hypothetical protein
MGDAARAAHRERIFLQKHAKNARFPTLRAAVRAVDAQRSQDHDSK